MQKLITGMMSALLLSFAPLVCAEMILYGIYSNIDARGGEPSGFEMIFLHDGRPGTCSDTVIMQVAEGWPQYPELLDCCGCTASYVEFTSAQWGKFVGKVENNQLIGEFVQARHRISLPKGLSYWQKQ